MFVRGDIEHRIAALNSGGRRVIFVRTASQRCDASAFAIQRAKQRGVDLGIEAQTVNWFWQGEALFFQRAHSGANGQAARFSKIGFTLIDPGIERQHDIGVAHRVDQRVGLGVLQDEIELADGIQSGFHTGYGVIFGIDAEFELKAPFRVGRVIEDDAFEHRRIGDAHVVTVEGHQDGRARSKAHDDAFKVIDHHVVLGPKRLAQAEHHAGNIVLHRVAHGKADGQTDHPGTAENGGNNRRRAEQIERQNNPQQQNDHAGGLGH